MTSQNRSQAQRSINTGLTVTSTYLLREFLYDTKYRRTSHIVYYAPDCTILHARVGLAPMFTNFINNTLVFVGLYYYVHAAKSNCLSSCNSIGCIVLSLYFYLNVKTARVLLCK